MNDNESNKTEISTFCSKCGKPFYYVGDVPNGGFPVGQEPWCICGTEICNVCGQRYVPKKKQCGHGEEI